MNKTFKVVFNRARGALMAANEITSSMQKKGTKTIVAIATAVACGIASAATYTETVDKTVTEENIIVELTGKDLIGIHATAEEKITIGQKGTTTTVKVVGDSGTTNYDHGVFADNIVSADKNGGSITIEGSQLDVTVNSYRYGYGIRAANRTTATNKEKATLIVNADQTNINVTSALDATESDGSDAIVAMSQGVIQINGNLKAKASNVIVARGYASVSINANSDKTVQLDGNINFNFDKKTSGTCVDATVLVNLTDSKSYWTGKSYVSGKDAPSDDYLKVNAFSIGLSNGAKWTLTGDSFVNTLTLKDGGKIDASKAEILKVGKRDASADAAVSGFKVKGTGNKLILGEKTILSGAITLVKDSELETSLTTAYSGASVKDGALSLADTVAGRLSFATVEEGAGTLVISDAFSYDKTEKLEKLTNLYSTVAINFTNATFSGEGSATLMDGVILGNTTAEVKVADKATTATIGASSSDTAVTTGAQTIELSKAVEVVTVKGGSNVTVVGKTDGSAFITKTDKVTVDKGATLNLGSAEAEAATSGTLPEITLEKTATLNVTNTAVTTSSLTGGEGVKINLGTTEAAGVLHTEKLALNGAMIFLDPAWQNGSTIRDASSFSAVTVDNFNGTIVAGQNSVVALGATKDAAVSGFNKLAQTNSLTWGSDGITAGLYIGTPLTLTPETSKILVNGLLTTAPTSVDAGLTIASNGILMVDQSGIGSNKAVSGVEKVTIAGDATVAVINAKGDTTLQLADAASISGYTEGEEPATKTVLTDNPFVKGTLTAKSGTIALSDYADETGINVIASMGVQSMIRHADAVLAETIADRAAEVTTGNGLWVSVRGERFEQKKLGGGAGFHANMGYGAFGAEFTPTDATSLGVAFQYGFGTVKGKLYSAKNKTKDYGFTVYGSTLLGDTGVKLLGEVSYTKSTNDLTNNYFTGLNQDLDAKMISGGITAQKHFAAGSFDLVPSVGVRVSRITTDAMKAGVSRIAKEKQTIVQVPVALRVNAKAIETEGGWAITPRFKVAFVPTFGDKEIKIFGTEKTVLDTTPVQGAFGVSFVKGNFTIDATANLGVSNKDTSSIGGKVGLSYRF